MDRLQYVDTAQGAKMERKVSAIVPRESSTTFLARAAGGLHIFASMCLMSKQFHTLAQF
jgi:hypothetical protein